MGLASHKTPFQGNELIPILQPLLEVPAEPAPQQVTMIRLTEGEGA
jgi:hypothetical protein